MTIRYVFLALSIIAGNARAEVPPEVRSQFEHDLKIMVEARGTGDFTNEQVSAAISSMVDDAIKQHPTAFQYTTEELDAFRSDGTLFSDAQIKDTYHELKVLADGRPMPVLTETYFDLFEKGSLTQKQKIVFQKLNLAIIEYTKKQIQK